MHLCKLVVVMDGWRHADAVRYICILFIKLKERKEIEIGMGVDAGVSRRWGIQKDGGLACLSSGAPFRFLT